MEANSAEEEKNGGCIHRGEGSSRSNVLSPCSGHPGVRHSTVTGCTGRKVRSIIPVLGIRWKVARHLTEWGLSLKATFLITVQECLPTCLPVSHVYVLDHDGPLHIVLSDRTQSPWQSQVACVSPSQWNHIIDSRPTNTGW